MVQKLINMTKYNFTAQIEKDIETGLYVGNVPTLPGAHTQAESLDELYNNLQEVIQLCLEAMSKEELKEIKQRRTNFFGFQRVSVAV